MKTLLFATCLLVFTTCGTNKLSIKIPDVQANESAVVPDSVKAIGIWQVPKNERYVHGTHKGTNWASGPTPERFIYDGTYITLMLVTEKDWMWKTPDDYYKVKSKWGHDTIFYLPPFGRWVPMATFKDDAFHYNYEIYDSVYSWTFKNIKAEDIDSGYTTIIKERKPHDYSIQPMDVYKE